METIENQSQRDEDMLGGEHQSRIKQKLGAFGRRMKRVDLRSQIIAHPFAATGIAAGVGAIVGLARPMPRRGRLSGAFVAILSTIGFRLVREAAIQQIGYYARQAARRTSVHEPGEAGMSAQAPQAGTTNY